MVVDRYCTDSIQAGTKVANNGVRMSFNCHLHVAKYRINRSCSKIGKLGVFDVLKRRIPSEFLEDGIKIRFGLKSTALGQSHY